MVSLVKDNNLKGKYGKKKRLPTNFAERVLELEMDLERDCSSIEKINSLLYLYSVIICLYIYSKLLNIIMDRIMKSINCMLKEYKTRFYDRKF